MTAHFLEENKDEQIPFHPSQPADRLVPRKRLYENRLKYLEKNQEYNFMKNESSLTHDIILNSSLI